MDKGKIFFIAIIVTLVLSFLLVFWLDIINVWTYLTALVVIGGVFVNGVVIKYYAKLFAERDAEKNKDKTTLPYCWRKINQLLADMPDGEAIQWDKSFGRRIKEKSFNDGKKLVRFLAVLAINSGTQQYNIIIYNIETENIVQLITSPSTAQLEDLFYKFEPFEKQAMGFPGMYGRGGKYNRRRGLSIPLGVENFGGDYMPGDSEMHSALDTLDGGQNDGR